MNGENLRHRFFGLILFPLRMKRGGNFYLLFFTCLPMECLSPFVMERNGKLLFPFLYSVLPTAYFSPLVMERNRRLLFPFLRLFADGGLFFRQREKELQPSFGTVLGRDASAVYENCILHDGESQPRAAELARPPLVYPVEPFEQTAQVFGRHSRSRVGKAEIIELVVFAEAADADLYVRAGISDGIVRQIAEDGV